MVRANNVELLNGMGFYKYIQINQFQTRHIQSGEVGGEAVPFEKPMSPEKEMFHVGVGHNF